MPTTSSGIYYPSSSDPVQVWADMQQQAESVQTVLDTSYQTSFTTYVPALTNFGTATFTGYWKYIPKLVWVNTNVLVNAAGSSASNIPITMPTNPDRALSQVIPAFFTGVIGAGAVLLGAAYMFSSGSGAVVDRIRGQSNGETNNAPKVTGAGLLAGAELVFQGIYRDA